MRATITRIYELQMAHALPNVPDGHKCARMHGHTWVMEVSIAGDVDPLKGWFLDFAELDELWARHVHDVLDHRCLNDFLDNPTTENLCVWVAGKLGQCVPGLVRVAAKENRRSCVAIDL